MLARLCVQTEHHTSSPAHMFLLLSTYTKGFYVGNAPRTLKQQPWCNSVTFHILFNNNIITKA